MDEYIDETIDYDDFEIGDNKESEIPISLSYSRLSDFDRNGPKVLVERTSKSTYAMSFGKVVDELLLPQDETVFEDNFIISDFEKPTATSGKLVDTILDNYQELPDIDTIKEVCEINKYWSNYSEEKLLETLAKNKVIEYLEEQFKGFKKEIIPSKMYMDARSIVDILRIHKHSKQLFNNTFEKLNQFKIEFIYRGVIFRGVIDRVNIDHEKKTIQVIDLKTGKDSYDRFTSSFTQYRYYFQAALYVIGMNLIKKEMGLEGYEVLPFQFLYIGRGERIPMIFDMTKKWQDASIKGFNWGSYNYRGLDEVIDEVKWHFNNNQYELTREVYESNGRIDLPDNMITLK